MCECMINFLLKMSVIVEESSIKESEDVNCANNTFTKFINEPT